MKYVVVKPAYLAFTQCTICDPQRKILPKRNRSESILLKTLQYTIRQFAFFTETCCVVEQFGFVSNGTFLTTNTKTF